MQTEIFRGVVSIAKLHLCCLCFPASTLSLSHLPQEDCCITFEEQAEGGSALTLSLCLAELGL